MDAPSYQDFKRIAFTLNSGEELRAISNGCRYLTIYKISDGGALEIRESIDGWDGGWTPLPYGFSIGFTSSRGVSFRNPGTAPCSYEVFYGRGPFADNRFIQDPSSFSTQSRTLSTTPVATVTSDGAIIGLSVGSVASNSTVAVVQSSEYTNNDIIDVKKLSVMPLASNTVPVTVNIYLTNGRLSSTKLEDVFKVSLNPGQAWNFSQFSSKAKDRGIIMLSSPAGNVYITEIRYDKR